MSHAYANVAQVVLHAAATDSWEEDVKPYQHFSGEAGRFNSVISMLLWRPK
jgi:hypothetical protein